MKIEILIFLFFGSLVIVSNAVRFKGKKGGSGFLRRVSRVANQSYRDKQKHKAKMEALKNKSPELDTPNAKIPERKATDVDELDSELVKQETRVKHTPDLPQKHSPTQQTANLNPSQPSPRKETKVADFEELDSVMTKPDREKASMEFAKKHLTKKHTPKSKQKKQAPKVKKEETKVADFEQLKSLLKKDD